MVVVVCVCGEGGGGRGGGVVVVVVVRTVCLTYVSVQIRQRVHLIGWQNTWEQAAGVPATPSPP